VDLPPPPRSDDPGALARLREALEAASYSHDGLEATLGVDGLSPSPNDAPIVERRLPVGRAISTYVRLFMLERPAPRGDAAAAFGPLGLEGAVELGLVADSGTEVVPLVRLVPSGGLTFASDRRTGSTQVMGVAPSSALLANLTVRQPVERALDVGTGSGVQAILAARHAERVVATDLSPRALAFAAFNLALNGVENVELREGSFFEPVEGERFGLVVSNPPFVVSPDLSITYRDAGLRGDAVSELVVREAAAHLEPGGFAHILVAWAHKAEGDWAAPVRGWVERSGCDTVLLRYVSDDPLTYAARWNPPAQTPDLDEVLDRWIAYYAELGIEAIAYGAIALRRREGANWVFAEDVPERIETASDHVEGLFELQDFLAGGRDLAYERLVLVDDHVLEQALHLEDGVFAVKGAAIRLTEGLGFQAGIDVWTAHVVTRLDGRRTVREAIADTAATLGPEGLSAEELGRAAMPALRRMVELGFLVPAGR
jgi:methylase of polypeptide subunit release factors